ncbi:aminoglycoside phosphotransferase family protein [Streptomyces sp. NBC_01808]|uniref:phosphotransferase family protein n=1 Tax=Streptomyces sp. NBC_01808 TaxID=2975947 RepID=UPI002DD8D261|nr:phosphotransferase [Streptomyces sp. NBC_01808]WSA37662.1 aminoglycoside phosphotransferase family protein [Streptomyces sp. NBC_01808]
MTAAVPIAGGFTESERQHVLERACAVVGLDGSSARLLRGHTNAVVLLAREPVVVKIARRGTRVGDVARTVAFVRWLMSVGFPTVSLLPVDQPVVVDQHAVTFWTYLPQPPDPVAAVQLAAPLNALHALTPSLTLPTHDNLRAIRRSISAIAHLPVSTVDYLSGCADRLESELRDVRFDRQPGILQGDPQHRNALHTPTGAVLCDWDTVTVGQPEWDLVTVEIHCRRFGHGRRHYERFADAYGWDVVRWPGYGTLARIRELRMITTNARKVRHTPGSLEEVKRRIEGVRRGDSELRWHIL